MKTIEEVLQELNIRYESKGGHHHTTHGWISIDCPHCSSNSGGFHLGINVSSHSCNCWRCGKHKLIDTLIKAAHIPYREIAAILSGVEKKYDPRKHHIGKYQEPYGVETMKKAHLEYLKRRGFDPEELITLWELEGIGISPKLRWRIFVPIIQESIYVSWTTRSIASSGLRWVSAKPEEEAVPLKSTLYGQDYVRHAVIVVEGPADVWAIGPGSVATYGTGFTNSQVLKLSKYPIRFVCYDSEPEAQAKANELCSLLEVFPGETHNVILDSKDAAEASKKEIRTLRNLLK